MQAHKRRRASAGEEDAGVGTDTIIQNAEGYMWRPHEAGGQGVQDASGVHASAATPAAAAAAAGMPLHAGAALHNAPPAGGADVSHALMAIPRTGGGAPWLPLADGGAAAALVLRGSHGAPPGGASGMTASSGAAAPRSTDIQFAVNRFEVDYELGEMLGHGTFSIVHKCRHRASGDVRAVKIIDTHRCRLSRGGRALPGVGGAPASAAEVAAAARSTVLEEVRILRALAQNQLIIHVMDLYAQSWGRDAHECVMIVTEFAPGGELFDSIIKAGNFTEAQAKHVMWQALHALAFMHEQGVVHRDLKPENLLVFSAVLTPAADPVVRPHMRVVPMDAVAAQLAEAAAAGKALQPMLNIKLADFGVARFLRGVGVETAGASTFVGSPQYVAPEVLFVRDSRGVATYGTAVDVYSMGVILYVCLAGYLPFEDNVPRPPEAAALPPLVAGRPETWEDRAKAGRMFFAPPVWTHISEGAKDLIRHMMHVDPARRFNIHQALAHPWFDSIRAAWAPPPAVPRALPAPAPTSATVLRAADLSAFMSSVGLASTSLPDISRLSMAAPGSNSNSGGGGGGAPVWPIVDSRVPMLMDAPAMSASSSAVGGSGAHDAAWRMSTPVLQLPHGAPSSMSARDASMHAAAAAHASMNGAAAVHAPPGGASTHGSSALALAPAAATSAASANALLQLAAFASAPLSASTGAVAADALATASLLGPTPAYGLNMLLHSAANEAHVAGVSVDSMSGSGGASSAGAALETQLANYSSIVSLLDFHQLIALQERLAATFKSAYAAVSGIPQAAAVVRRHAVAARDLQAHTVRKVILQCRTLAQSITMLLPDLLEGVKDGDAVLVQSLFTRVGLWVRELKEQAHAMQSAYQRLISEVQMSLEEARAVQSDVLVRSTSGGASGGSSSALPGSSSSSSGGGGGGGGGGGHIIQSNIAAYSRAHAQAAGPLPLLPAAPSYMSVMEEGAFASPSKRPAFSLPSAPVPTRTFTMSEASPVQTLAGTASAPSSPLAMPAVTYPAAASPSSASQASMPPCTPVALSARTRDMLALAEAALNAGSQHGATPVNVGSPGLAPMPAPAAGTEAAARDAVGDDLLSLFLNPTSVLSDDTRRAELAARLGVSSAADAARANTATNDTASDTSSFKPSLSVPTPNRVGSTGSTASSLDGVESVAGSDTGSDMLNTALTYPATRYEHAPSDAHACLALALANLRTVDGILAQSVDFWTTMELMVDVMARRKEHCETLLLHSSTPRLRDKADSNVQFFRTFWAAFVDICTKYANSIPAATAQYYAWLSDASMRLESGVTLTGADRSA